LDALNYIIKSHFWLFLTALIMPSDFINISMKV